MTDRCRERSRCGEGGRGGLTTSVDKAAQREGSWTGGGGEVTLHNCSSFQYFCEIPPSASTANCLCSLTWADKSPLTESQKGLCSRGDSNDASNSTITTNDINRKRSLSPKSNDGRNRIFLGFHRPNLGAFRVQSCRRPTRNAWPPLGPGTLQVKK